MPQPLIFDPDATKEAGRGWWRFFDIGTFLLFAAAMALLLRLGSHGYVLDASSGRTELLMRALPFIFLALMCALMSAKPRRYQVANDETVEGRSRPIASWKKTWWSTLPLWPAYLFGAIVLTKIALKGSIGPVDAISVFLATVAWLGVTLLTWAFLLPELEIRINGEGLRVGLNYFVEWNRVSRIVDTGDRLEVIHAEYPTPLVAFYGEDSSSDLLRKYASLHNISIERGRTAALISFKVQHAVLALILFLLGLGSYVLLRADAFIVFMVVFGVAIMATFQLESWRGLSKITRIKPPVDKASLKLKPGQALPEPLPVPPIPPVPDDTSRR